jgi:hypothetical protein
MGDHSNSGAPRASLMRQAEAWAAAATRDELKAHAAAIWQAMPATDRAGFADFIGRTAVAAVFRRPEIVDMIDAEGGA